MSDKDFNNLKQYLLKGIASAGVAVAISELLKKNDKNPRKSALKDADKSKSSIVVPINIPNFVKDLKVPEDVESKATLPTEDKPLLENKDPESVSNTMSEDEIAAIKKDILRKNERKFRFFGKAAADDKTSSEDANEDSKDESKETNESKSYSNGDGDRKDKRELPPRDELGKFVSPTNPVGVKQVEKSAFFNMDDVLSSAWDASKKPLGITAGAFTALYVASKIKEAINRRREKLSEKHLNESRDRYVSLVQKGDSEKTAGVGNIIAGTFIFPAAITALVTNKIIENRKKDKEKKKENVNSFPDEPAILYETVGDSPYKTAEYNDIFKSIIYKTASGSSVEIDAKTAVAMIMVKQALFMAAEEPIDDKVMSKCAYSTQEAVDKLYDYISDPKNNKYLLAAAEAATDKRGANREAVVKALMGAINPVNMAFHHKAYDNPEVQKAFLNDKRLYKLISSRFADKQYADSWGKFRDNLIDSRLGEWISPDSWLHKLISWFLKSTGLGQRMAISGAKNYLDKIRDAFNNPTKPNSPDKENSLGLAHLSSRKANRDKNIIAMPENIPGVKLQALPSPTDQDSSSIMPKPLPVPNPDQAPADPVKIEAPNIVPPESPIPVLDNQPSKQEWDNFQKMN